jgi:hypothetical protein
MLARWRGDMNCYEFQHNLFYQVKFTFNISFSTTFGDGSTFSVQSGLQNEIETFPASENMPRGFMVCPAKFAWWGNAHSWAKRGVGCEMFSVSQHYFSNQKINLHYFGTIGEESYDYYADLFITNNEESNINNFGLSPSIPIFPWDPSSAYFTYAKTVFEQYDQNFSLTLYAQSAEGYYPEFSAFTENFNRSGQLVPINILLNGESFPAGNIAITYTIG